MNITRITGMASGLDVDQIVKNLMKVQRSKVDKAKGDKILLEWKKNEWKSINLKIYDFYRNDLSSLKSNGTFQIKKTTVSNSNIADAVAGVNTQQGTYSLEVLNMAKSAYMTGNVVPDKNVNFTAGEQIDISYNGKVTTISLTGGDINSVIKDINSVANDTGITASYDSNLGKIFLIGTAEDGQSISVGDHTGGTLLTSLGLSGASSTQSQLARVKFNEVEYTFNTNNFSINGINLSLKSEAPGVKNTIQVSNDIDAVYNKIKNFVKKYNELVNGINKETYTESARGYRPLTDEQKEGMSEKEIELWENKIKDSLLKNDSVLNSVKNSMRNILMNEKGTSSPGFEYLSDIGIVTGDYTEKGLIHIKGDSEETNTVISSADNRLLKLLNESPEKVQELLNNLGQKLYADLTEKMKSTELRSALNLYNDKMIDKQIDNYKNTIAKLEDKMTTMESFYYKQFASLERAMTQMSAQSGWLMNQFGGNQ